MKPLCVFCAETLTALVFVYIPCPALNVVYCGSVLACLRYRVHEAHCLIFPGDA